MKLRFHRYENEVPADGAASGAAAPAPAADAGGPLTPPSNLVAEAGGKNTPVDSKTGGALAPAAGEQPAPAAGGDTVTREQMREALAKTGAKAEDLAKLSDADLAVQYQASQFTDFTNPEGVTLDKGMFPDLKQAFAKAGLNQEQAQGLLNELGGKIFTADAVKQQVEGLYKQWFDTQSAWQNQIKADAEIGGQNFDKVMATVAKGFELFAADAKEAQAIKDAFNFTGAGNNPEIVRMFYRVLSPYMEGEATAEGSPPSHTQKSAAQVLYPSQGKG